MKIDQSESYIFESSNKKELFSLGIASIFDPQQNPKVCKGFEMFDSWSAVEQ